mmetsp:Transcript_3901/g.11111  ORF Transcript_3901/g.11111 Transcript_3901/m.11111 type:complete len:258 (+) Transcript_3901:483-1256(+)
MRPDGGVDGSGGGGGRVSSSRLIAIPCGMGLPPNLLGEGLRNGVLAMASGQVRVRGVDGEASRDQRMGPSGDGAAGSGDGSSGMPGDKMWLQEGASGCGVRCKKAAAQSVPGGKSEHCGEPTAANALAFLVDMPPENIHCTCGVVAGVRCLKACGEHRGVHNGDVSLIRRGGGVATAERPGKSARPGMPQLTGPLRAESISRSKHRWADALASDGHAAPSKDGLIAPKGRGAPWCCTSGPNPAFLAMHNVVGATGDH